MTLAQKTCERCGAAIPATKRSHARFCSSNCQKRAHEAAWRRACPRCGTPMAAGTGYPANKDKSKTCLECRLDLEREVVDERGRQIEAWWAVGLSRREISERLGWTENHVNVEIQRLRALGYDLPYRYQLSRPSHPEQVVAT